MNSRRLQRTSSAAPTTSTAVKRDSLAAELERDPQYSTAKRQQRTQLFTNSISHASLERQLLAAQTARVDLETKLRERELQVERLERDRRHFADREREEREANEREQAENNAHRKRTDAELKALRAELSSLRETHADLQDTHTSLARTSSQSISQHKSLLTTLQHRTSLLEEELVEATTLVDSRSQQLQEAHDKIDELQAVQDENQQRVRDEK
ncbi:hypothetical protein P691DRAFT_509211 [Macrolepiota fuliginosa MF-IS2]|uniref:Spindle assembly checkpoint component MAD1 n=1 Tax=Macrolepiota fuliginosa MF-IS2 TaxID=1400762 RepID=A0A9P5X2J3_9AGAR|nr:hypothetical protein P691DRAFT_509211 [Macrolepiota fuliginosa MF-IS2]